MRATPGVIAANLKRFRAELGLSQEQAAHWLGWPLVTYQRFEQGRRGMDADQLMQAAAAFGRSMDDFGKSDPPARSIVEIPPFRLSVRPGVALPPGLADEARSAIQSLNERYFASLSSSRSKS